MKCKSRRLEMKVGVIMNTVNLSGELNVKLLRFDCNFFSPSLSGNRNQRFLKNCLLRCAQNV